LKLVKKNLFGVKRVVSTLATTTSYMRHRFLDVITKKTG